MKSNVLSHADFLRIGMRFEVLPNGCWQWKGDKNRNGYGRWTVGGKEKMIHRIVYEAVRGPIQEGMVCDHLCRNKSCGNPAHIEIVTNQVNVARGVWKSHCPSGHKLEGRNLVMTKTGWRACRACKVAATKAWRVRLRMESHVN